jgi:hypothetical protein
MAILVAYSGDLVAGPQVVIIDGDRVRPLSVSFLSSNSEDAIWQLTARTWFGWPKNDGTVLITCQVAGRTQREEFSYVTGGPPMPAIHVTPQRCAQ